MSIDPPDVGRSPRRLGSAGQAESERMRVTLPDRLITPLHRVGPKGNPDGGRISWGDAIREIATRWKRIIDEHSAAAILAYSFSGTTGWVDLGLSNPADVESHGGRAGFSATPTVAAGSLHGQQPSGSDRLVRVSPRRARRA
jgi:hypothetical protein